MSSVLVSYLFVSQFPDLFIMCKSDLCASIKNDTKLSSVLQRRFENKTYQSKIFFGYKIQTS
jgi:hypothetical protein